MTTTFGTKNRAAPSQISSEPQKGQAKNPISQGLEHRPFSDDEIKQAFDTFDLDKNRFVGAAEIAHILQVIGEDVTDEEIDEMIRLCDADGDGQVTFDEFKKLMSNPPPPPQPPTAKKAPKRRNRAARTQKFVTSFSSLELAEDKRKKPPARQSIAQKQAEKDKDKQFRASSVEALVQRLSGGIGKIKPSQIKKVYKRFRDIDVDGSNSIDYEEFRGALELEDNLVSQKMFRVFDMDGSGAIDLKEFIVVLSRYTAAARTEKLKFAFMMFDEDGSGFIERDELLDMLNASFIVENLSQDELEDKADGIFEFLELQPEDGISYDDFLKLAKARQGLIYPVEMHQHELGKDASINKYFEDG